MYRRLVSQLRPGHTLAKTLYTRRGDVLLGAGTTLNAFFIARLHDRGILSVYLQDGLGDDIEPTDIVSEEVRASTVTHLSRAYDVIATMAHGSKLNNLNRPRTVDDLVDRLGEKPLKLPPRGVGSLQ